MISRNLLTIPRVHFFLSVGRLCEWVSSDTVTPNDYDTFEEYRDQFRLECRDGEAANLTVTPNDDWPGAVYYQVRA